VEASKPMRGPDEEDSTRAGAPSRPGRAEAPRLRHGDPQPHPDAGFTFFELLIALSILLVTVVAVTGLMMTSTYMTSAAREKSAMVNAAAGYLERVRQVAFSDIGTPGGDPPGVLVSSSVSSGPYALVVTPQVSWGRPEDPTNRAFKTVTATVVASGGSGASVTYTSSAIVGESGSVTAAPTTDATPTVVVAAPPDGSAVWGSAASVTVSGTASSPARTLVSLGLYDGGTVVGLMVASGQAASASFTWNTTGVREGLHALTPTAVDSKGQTIQGPVSTLLVDNVAPGVPVSPAIAVPDGSSLQVWWGASQDGTGVDGSTPLAASHYATAVWQQRSSSSTDYTQWTSLAALSLSVVQAPTSSSPLTLSGLAGFDRFAVAVKASSPDRGAGSGLLSSAAVLTGITRPTLTGTWTATKSGNKYTVAVTLGVPTGPAFPWSGTASTKFYRLTSATQAVTSGTLLATVSSSNPSWTGVAATDTQTTGSNKTPTAYWYGAVTTLTPQGYGASQAAVQSSVIGPPADMIGSGTQGMVFARW
jgi:hypothetical protein